jgi:protein tyrosine/serine phosphatase
MPIRHPLRASAALLIVLAGGQPAAAADASTLTMDPPIVRFARVDDTLYRGGQPDASGFAQLKRLGVKTVVNLRRDDGERAIVEGLGMRYVDLSTGLTPFGLGEGIRADVVRRFFEVVDDEAGGPVFVHCRRGADRTGTLVAMYRIARQGWTAEAAYDEARSIGMRWWHYPVKERLQEFAATVGRPVPPPVPAAVPVG